MCNSKGTQTYMITPELCKDQGLSDTNGQFTSVRAEGIIETEDYQTETMGFLFVPSTFCWANGFYWRFLRLLYIQST